MSHISSPPPEAASGRKAEMFAQLRKSVGEVPNGYGTDGALEPAALKSFSSPMPCSRRHIEQTGPGND